MSLKLAALLGGTVRRLANVRRYGALRASRAENVAEHSFWTALTALAIARDLESLGVELDVLEVVEGALLHDVDEAVAGDVPSPLINSVPGFADMIRRAGEKFVAGIARDLGIDSMKRTWRTQFVSFSIEGMVIRLADRLEVAAYVAGEVLAGNRHFEGVAVEVVESLRPDDYPPNLRSYVIEAREWLKTISQVRVPGDVERIANLNG